MPVALHRLKSTCTNAGCLLLLACSLRLLMEALKDTTSSRSTVAATTCTQGEIDRQEDRAAARGEG